MISLPQEHFFRLTVNESYTITLICTNEALQELTVGFLFHEGFIHHPGEILSLNISEDGVCGSVAVKSPCILASGSIRNSGLGGPQLFDAHEPPARRDVHRTFGRSYLARCLENMKQSAIKYARTGGVHCSALFDGSARLSVFEDIGRHNTLDKIAGDCMLRNLCTDDTLLVTTGRISSDMVRKAGKMGVSAIASCSVPTSLAFDLAEAAGITLVGRAEKAPQVYCRKERISD